jgi:thiamine biosynthesis lipoprotein
MAGIRAPLEFLIALALSTVCCAQEEPLQKFIFEKAEMGVPFRITLYAKSEANAKSAADAAFARVEALNQILSDYEDDSELSRLSRSSGSGKAVKVSDELWTVLSRAQALAERTQGGFDVTCGPLTAMWRRARRKQELPSPDLVAEMRSRTGWRKMRLDEKARTVELLAPDMRLDLGSIAKGYACDEALKILRENGCARALVAGSGDMIAGDAPPSRKGWRVEVVALDAGPASENTRPLVVEIANAAIATSGDRFQRLEIGGKRLSHILDVRTGEPLIDHSLVSIIAPDGITADCLATAASVLGPVEGMKLISESPRVEARFQRQPAEKVEIAESPGWAAWLAE